MFNKYVILPKHNLHDLCGRTLWTRFLSTDATYCEIILNSTIRPEGRIVVSTWSRHKRELQKSHDNASLDPQFFLSTTAIAFVESIFAMPHFTPLYIALAHGCLAAEKGERKTNSGNRAQTTHEQSHPDATACSCILNRQLLLSRATDDPFNLKEWKVSRQQVKEESSRWIEGTRKRNDQKEDPKES